MSEEKKHCLQGKSSNAKPDRGSRVKEKEKIVVTSLQNALRKFSSKNDSHVYSALVAIRTKFIKEKDGVSRFRELGGVEKLLSLLKKSSDKVLDVATSILGNCSLEEHTRSKILSLDGVSILGDLLRKVSVESIQNRVCRTLANLALDKHCCQVIHNDGKQEDESSHGKTSLPVTSVVDNDDDDDSNDTDEDEGERPTIVEVTVRLLQNATGAECQQTALRALRLFGDTDGHRRNILECQGQKVVCQCLKSEDKDVILSTLKAASHFMQGTISDAVVWQFVNAEGPSSLLTLTSHKVKDISDHASSMVLSFVKQQALRPCLGNAGAVTHFIAKAELESLSFKQRLPYVNGLCLFCHEVVNRVRIRDEHGLELLLKFLDNRQYAPIHYRIISALVCHLHDDPSMELLLQNKLVVILIRHLNKCAGLKSLNLIESLMTLSDKVINLNKDDQLYESIEVANDLKVECEMEETEANDTLDNTLEFENLDDHAKEPVSETISNDHPGKQVKEFHGSITDLHPSDKKDGQPDVEKTKAFHRSASAPTMSWESKHKEALNPKTDATGDDDGDISDGAKRRVDKEGIKYSMDSPTYKEISQMTVEEPHHSSGGPRNIFEARAGLTARLSPYSSPSHSTSVYSPLSTSSYASPSWSLKSSPERCTSPSESLLSYAQPKSPSSEFSGSRTSGMDWSENLTTHSNEAGSSRHSNNMESSRSYSPLTLQSPPSSPVSLQSGADMWWNSGKDKGLVYSDEESDTDIVLDKEDKIRSNDKAQKHGLKLKIMNFGGEFSNSVVGGGVSPLILSQNSDSTFSQPLRSDPIYAETMMATDFGKALKGENLARAISVESNVEQQLFHDGLKSENDKNDTPSNNKTAGDNANARKGKKRKLSTGSSMLCYKRRPSVSLFEDLLQKSQQAASDNNKVANDEANKPVDKYREAKKTTENNILVILSKLSYIDDQCTHLMCTIVFNTLILYAMLASDPITRVERILRRLSQNPKCLEGLLLHTIPLKLDLCHSVCKQYLKFKRRSVVEGNRKKDDPDSIDDEKFEVNASCVELFSRLVNCVSMNVASKYGGGVVEHLLLTGSDKERLHCSLNLPVICRHEQTLKKYLFDTGGLENVLQALYNQHRASSVGVDNPVSLELILYYFHKMALLGDLVLLYKGVGMNPKLPCCQGLLKSLSGQDLKRGLSKSKPVFDSSGSLHADIKDDRLNISKSLSQKSCDVSTETSIRSEIVGEQKNSTDDRVTFLFDDGARVTSTRDLLVKTSSVFAAMLNGPFSESKKSEIELPQTQSKPFQVLISLLQDDMQYLQSLCHSTQLDILLDVLKLCDRFLLAEHLQDLSNVVFSLVSDDSLVEVLHFAMQHNCYVLTRRCLSYLLISEVTHSLRLTWFRKLLKTADIGETVDLLRSVFTNHMAAKLQVCKA